MKKVRMLVLLLVVVCFITTGCGKKKAEYAKISNDIYTKGDYSTSEVKKGSLTPEFTLRLQGENMKKTNYKVDNKLLEIEKLYVSQGDKVKKGDLLLSFKSKDIQKTIDDNEEKLNQNNLLIDHYSRIMQYDSSADYKADIEMLKEDNNICSLYIEDAKEKLAGYQIVAETDGTISFINDFVVYGFYNSGDVLISEVGESGNYTVTTQKDYDFEVGQVYTAKSKLVSYDLKIIKLDKQKNTEGVITQTLVFEPVTDMSAVSDEEAIEINIEQPELSNVLYVDSDALHSTDDGYYVYTLDENGYREATKVEVGDTVGSNTIILDGLQEGEKVTRY